MPLTKYATKEEIELALIILGPRNKDDDDYITPTRSNYHRLLLTATKLYEILDSLQAGLRELELLARQSESKQTNYPVSDDPGGLPEHPRNKPVIGMCTHGPISPFSDCLK